MSLAQRCSGPPSLIKTSFRSRTLWPIASSPSSQQDVVFGLGGPGGAAALVALKSGGSDALVGALVLLGLLALARKLIRLAGDPAPEDTDRPPPSPP